MVEKGITVPELFSHLPREKARLLAQGLAFAEATHGCSSACRICFIPAPVGVKRYMPARTLSAIHSFIGKYDPQGTDYFAHHEAGQLSDYFDPETGWDMADVIEDCLAKTQRKVSLFLHGIDGEDGRAVRAAGRLWELPEALRKRVEITVSTDPFGPVNVPAPEAEGIGRARALNALQLFQGWPQLELRIFTPNIDKHRADEEQRVREMFGAYVPSHVDVLQIQQPTRVRLPGVDHPAMIEDCNGYGIRSDGSLLFKQFPGPFGWPKIGMIDTIDPNLIQRVSHMMI